MAIKMKFEEALAAMREGHPIRRECKCYFVMDKCGEISTIIDYVGDCAKLSNDDITAEDWEIIE